MLVMQTHLIDMTDDQRVVIVFNDRNLVINVNSNEIIVDFWEDADNDGESDGKVVMTFDDLRDLTA